MKNGNLNLFIVI